MPVLQLLSTIGLGLVLLVAIGAWLGVDCLVIALLGLGTALGLLRSILGGGVQRDS